MTPTYGLHVETQGGVTDLGRVVGVLALYDLTPLSMVVQPEGLGLQIDLRLNGDPRSCELCIGRLSAIMAVRHAQLTAETPLPGDRP